MVEKVCKKCGVSKPHSLEHFSRHHRGNLKGVCRICERERQRVHKQKPHSRLLTKLNGYKRHDEANGRVCDITVVDLERLTKEGCIYCGTKDFVGLDRIDNNRGHTLDNVLPCCYLCNATRSDRFTVEEMKLIGEVIKTIRMMRK